MYRLSNSKLTESYIETGRKGTGVITFAAKGTGTVTITVSSNGGNNWSDLLLTDGTNAVIPTFEADGSNIGIVGNIVTLKGSGTQRTLTYTLPKAGNYTFVAGPTKENGGITETKTDEGQTSNNTVDATDYSEHTGRGVRLYALTAKINEPAN